MRRSEIPGEDYIQSEWKKRQVGVEKNNIFLLTAERNGLHLTLLQSFFFCSLS